MVEDSVIVELKAVEKGMPIHEAQLLSYLKLSKTSLGLLINFNVVHLKEGIKRMAHGLSQESQSSAVKNMPGGVSHV